MVEIINLYNTHEKSIKITSLTPTNYSIIKGSVYAPIK
jgi:4-hydroxy 2-oxovalerate aldolase